MCAWSPLFSDLGFFSGFGILSGLVAAVRLVFVRAGLFVGRASSRLLEIFRIPFQQFVGDVIGIALDKLLARRPENNVSRA